MPKHAPFRWIANTVRPRGLAEAVRADDLRRYGGAPPQTLQVPDWCGCTTEYLPMPVGDGWWSLVPIWQPDLTPDPLRRWQPAVPYWARDP